MGQDPEVEREDTKSLPKFALERGFLGIVTKFLIWDVLKNTFLNLYAFITKTGADCPIYLKGILLH